MKPKLTILTLVGVITWNLVSFAQDTPSAITNSQATPVNTTEAAPATVTSDVAPVASEPAAATDSTVTTEVLTSEAAAVPTTMDEPQPNAVIPLIVMDDVPLTDAIKNLARQANLNYILDPRIPYGQVGPDGKVTPQPSISLRWEKLTAEQALTALLNNYNLVLVDDPRTKIARISVKDPAAPDPLQTKIIQLKYASPSNMIVAVQSGLVDKRSRVVADTRTSQLVIVATEKEMLAVEEMVERLDAPTRQVLIEARILETSKSPSTIKGIDWSGTLEAQNVQFGNNVSGGQGGRYSRSLSVATNIAGGFISTTTYGPNNTLATPRLLIDTARGFNPSTAFLDADGVSAVLSFLNKDSDAQLLSNPRTVTLDNESANIAVTRAVPIFKNTAGTQGSPGGSEVTYTNLGTILNVTPRISANDYIWLKVVPEVSSVFRTVTKVVASTVNEADEYDIRKMETQVLIPSGNTLVMGGLMSDSRGKDYTKVPVLGDLPGLGLLFRKDSKTQNKRNLLIFITPTIVKDDDFQPTKSDFLKTTLEEFHDETPTFWDSGKPVDWSKPVFDASDSAPAK